MEGLGLRRAEKKDISQMTEILNQSIRWGKATAFLEELRPVDRLSWLENHSTDPYVIFVAEERQEILGYLSLGPYRAGREAFRHVAEVSYFVHFDHHRKGIASSLMDHALNHCRKNGIEVLLAFLYASNAASIHFLEKYGFGEWGFYPGLIKKGKELSDHVVYGVNLTS